MGGHASQGERAVVRARWADVIRRVVVQREKIVARGVGEEPERIKALGVESLLRRENAVPAHGELGDVGVQALVGARSVAIGAARGGHAAVKNIKKPAALGENGAHRVGAT